MRSRRPTTHFLNDLEALVGWSLVRSEASDGASGSRCSRRFASTRSTRFARTSALDELRERHAEHFLELALEAGARSRRPDQARWLDRLERETSTTFAQHSNGSSPRASVEDALRATAALEPLLARARAV